MITLTGRCGILHHIPKNVVLRSRLLPVHSSWFSYSFSRVAFIYSPLPHANAQGLPTIHYPRHAAFSSKNALVSGPSRRDIFYHLVDPPSPISSNKPAFALSFLTSPPPSSKSSTIIGWLPTTSEGVQAGLSDFKENHEFRRILHKAIQQGLQDELDDIQINRALQLQQGWMHIHDERNIPPVGRIGDPDDILASVLVKDSKILSETYQPMPAYRFCTSDGLTKLTPGLAQRLLALLSEMVELERTG